MPAIGGAKKLMSKIGRYFKPFFFAVAAISEQIIK